MLIAQITDVHLGFDRDNPDERNRQRLDAVLVTLAQLDPRPDLLLATGDLVEDGEDSLFYVRWREAITGLPFPVYPLMGNHDSRRGFLAMFPQFSGQDGYVQYVIDDFDLRVVVLDTLEPGRHGGHLCEARASWLADRLDEAPARPTLIALHHPPIATGIGWMTERPDAGWVSRLEGVLAGRRNIVALVAGHVHRPIVTPFAESLLIVCSSTAPQVALDLRPIDPERPDRREMIVAEPPAFALHLWDGTRLVSHFGQAGGQEVLARFTPQLQPLVRRLAREKVAKD